MKIAVLGGWAPSLIKFRGPLLEAMVERGHDVTAMAADPDPATTEALRRIGVTFVEVPLRRNNVDPVADARTLAALTRTLRRLRADLLFTYTIKPMVYGSLAARVAGVPRRTTMVTGMGYPLTGEGLRRRALTQVTRRLCRLALDQCDTVFFQNPDNLADFRGHGMLRNGAQVDIVRGSGVDLAHYQVTPLPPGPMVFVFVGRLLNEKGFREYIDMAIAIRRQRDDVRFQVIGWLDSNPDSVSDADLQRWIDAGIIEYLGELKDVRPALSRAHCLVLPSYAEGTPRSVLEAMSMGRAVITTDAPGCRETTVDGETGLVVPVRDAGALISAGERLLADHGLVERLATAARARAETLYDARKVAARMVDVMGI